jgi:tetratricopeptide (TPR) repeat protein/transcriptional regulator with XRE-family HTH domain
MAEGQGFGALLRQRRADAGLTQEELAEAASLSPRSISDLERGINLTARKETTRLLADALHLSGPPRDQFELAASGRVARSAEPALACDLEPTIARTLPRDTGSFTGRQAELDRLLGQFGGVGGGVIAIHAIGGMAGVGKTTLAVHAAHQLAPRFPDGQFFLPLHGHTPGQLPVEPGDALASLLVTAGVAARQIPVGTDARAARWRDYLAGHKVLLVLDDATGHQQVSPLLPGTGESMVLITSRRRLTALADVESISLDTLDPGEACVLLGRLAGQPGLAGRDGPAAEITRMCGYLPLAIGMVAGQLKHHPAWSAEDLAISLAAARDRLELLRAEDLSVAAAFELSYRDLSVSERRLLRCLGLHPGPDIDAYAAVALDGTGLDETRRNLESLYQHYLISEPTQGRYRLHDLLRAHARALAAALPAPERDAAIRRLLDYYEHAAAAASRHIPRWPAAGPNRLSGPPPGNLPPMPSRPVATAWLALEVPNLRAAVTYAANSGYAQHAVGIPVALNAFLHARGSWEQACALYKDALAAALQSEDRPGQAQSLVMLAGAQGMTGETQTSAASLNQALAISRDLGDPAGQGHALAGLGFLRWQVGDYRAASALLREGLALYQQVGHRSATADCLNELGGVCWQTGDYGEAAGLHRQALALFRAEGHQLGEADALLNLGIVERLTGGYPRAAALCREALALYEDVGDLYKQAFVCSELAILRRMSGDLAAAAAGHQRAIQRFRELGTATDLAYARKDLGIVQRQAGNWAEAAAGQRAALEVFRQHNEPQGLAQTLNDLGETLSGSPERQRGRECHDEALAVARRIGDPLQEARALEGLGCCSLHDGDRGTGLGQVRLALAIYERIGVPEARRAEATLSQARAASS